MNTLKDTKNNSLTGQKKALPLINYASNLIKQTPARVLADRAQKIVTAVYLITDIIYIKDNLRESIRQKSLDALQTLLDNYAIDYNVMSLKQAQHDLYAMLSYVDVVYRIGGISEMNYSVLVKETHALQKDINEQINNDGKVDESGLNISGLFKHDVYVDKNTSPEQKQTKDIPQTFLKKELLNAVVHSEIKQSSPKNISTKTQGQKITTKQDVKNKRHSDILSILEQKKNASIKDICLLFKDCGSKTIQRDLNTLIANKKVVKRGDRRWAVYNIAR